MNIDIKLKQAREEKKISLSELSSITGIAKSTLQRYETGTTKKIPLYAISKIEHALNLQSGYLLGWLDDVPATTKEEKNINKIELTPEEEKIINAYRSAPQMQEAVKKLLGIE